MEQLYLLEFYVTKLSITTPPGGASAEDKQLTVSIEFGKFSSMIIKENEFMDDILQDDLSDDEIEFDSNQNNPETITSDEDLEKSFVESTTTEKTFNAGTSLLFSHNPIGLRQTFRLFPLEVAVWTDDESEWRACVGCAKIIWDSEFILKIVNTPETKLMTDSDTKPLTLEVTEELRSEVSGSVIGQITFVIQLTTVGSQIVTRFRQAEDGVGYLFRDGTGNGSVRCKKYGVNPKQEDIITYGTINEDWDSEAMDVGKLIERSKAAAAEGCYSAGEQMRKSDKPNRVMTVPCGNPTCKLTELLEKVTGDDSRSKNDPRKADGKCPPSNQPMMNSGEDCCCNCKYLNVPLEKDQLPPFSDTVKYVTCEICGGVSYDGKTCKEDAKKKCTGPCNADKGSDKDPCGKDPQIQRMLYEGLSKMLSSAKSGNHKKFCPDFKHKQSCPIRERCCR